MGLLDPELSPVDFNVTLCRMNEAQSSEERGVLDSVTTSDEAPLINRLHHGTIKSNMMSAH
ncbi:hypothetical protein EXN66_Car021044 [Channa argus]|uniref:Uncharacterized protein n=1 Tax=Channa argus TaxID=215402 RepID=A0A6G1QSS8_CHAAH|nr:hypothetical protein EXN66_Car021044 [Channa argus]